MAEQDEKPLNDETVDMGDDKDEVEDVEKDDNEPEFDGIEDDESDVD